jgi:hypothetical protein
MVNSVVACAQKGFDGIQDDIEDITPNTTYQNLVDYWNAETVALHNVGKQNIPFYYFSSYDAQYFAQINADYVALCLYGSVPYEESVFKEIMDLGLTNAISPCLVSMETGADGGDVLGTQFGWVDSVISESGPYSNLAGFALYDYEEISSSEWAAWDNW